MAQRVGLEFQISQTPDPLKLDYDVAIDAASDPVSSLTLSLRKPEFFQNIANGFAFPGNLQVLRLLSLLIFDGDKLQTDSDASDEVKIKTVSFSGQNVVVFDSTVSEPFLYFTVNAALPQAESTLIDNLVPDWKSPVILRKPSIANCAHSIDDALCLKCASGYLYLSGFCTACQANANFNYSLSNCFYFASRKTFPISELNFLNVDFVDEDFFGTGNTQSLTAEVWSPIDVEGPNGTIIDTQKLTIETMLDQKMVAAPEESNL